jgi:hypothetical protein
MNRITKRTWAALNDEQRWDLFLRTALQRDNAELLVSRELQRRGSAAADALQHTRRALANLDIQPATT